MGRKSINENKSKYFISREEAGLTRAQASERLGGISESQLEKLETGKTLLFPKDVVHMAEAYKRPDLCNYYCTHDCDIGKISVPQANNSSLSEIVLVMLSALNSLETQKNRLIEITADGIISDDELQDFVNIRKQLDHIDKTLEELKIGISNTINEGKIDKERLEQLMNS